MSSNGNGSLKANGVAEAADPVIETTTRSVAAAEEANLSNGNAAKSFKLKIFVGYDPREDLAYEVCRYSILKRSSIPVEVHPIKQSDLRSKGLYWHERGPTESTEFSFNRFLTPVAGEGRRNYRDALAAQSPLEKKPSKFWQRSLQKVGHADRRRSCGQHVGKSQVAGNGPAQSQISSRSLTLMEKKAVAERCLCCRTLVLLQNPTKKKKIVVGFIFQARSSSGQV